MPSNQLPLSLSSPYAKDIENQADLTEFSLTEYHPVTKTFKRSALQEHTMFRNNMVELSEEDETLQLLKNSMDTNTLQSLMQI